MEKTVHKTRVEACARCRFFDIIGTLQTGESVSICRRGGPRTNAALIMAPGDGGVPVPRWLYTTFWNRVAATDWCDHYREES